MALTNAEAEELLGRDKRITQPVVWKPRENRQGYEIEVAVGFHNPQTGAWELGRLVAIAVPGRRVRCSLLFANIPIRRLCDKGGHKNPDREHFEGFHKHRWDETDNQRWAYVPEDIDPTPYREEPDTAVREFLVECGIDVVGPYQGLLL